MRVGDHGEYAADRAVASGVQDRAMLAALNGAEIDRLLRRGDSEREAETESRDELAARAVDSERYRDRSRNGE